MYREKIKPKPRSDKWHHIENQPIRTKVVLAANTPKSSLLLHNLGDSKQITSPSTVRGGTAAQTTRRSIMNLETNMFQTQESYQKQGSLRSQKPLSPVTNQLSQLTTNCKQQPKFNLDHINKDHNAELELIYDQEQRLKRAIEIYQEEQLIKITQNADHLYCGNIVEEMIL